MTGEKTIYITVYNGDKPDDDVYELKVKKDKTKQFWHLMSQLCEPYNEI